jgi:cytoskeletal protein RodZ
MSPNDIHSAKQIGRLLRREREEQSANLYHLSKRCGLGVAQLVHIENGNLFAFESDLDRLRGYSNIYAQALNIDTNTFIHSPVELMGKVEVPVDSHIPRFLLKKN